MIYWERKGPAPEGETESVLRCAVGRKARAGAAKGKGGGKMAKPEYISFYIYRSRELKLSRTIFYDLNNDAFYYFNSWEISLREFIVSLVMLYLALGKGPEIYCQWFFSHGKLWFCLISNGIWLLYCRFSHRECIKRLHPYYSGKLEFYDKLEEMKRAGKRTSVVMGIILLIMTFCLYGYFRTGSYSFLAVEWGCVVLLYFPLAFNKVLWSKKVIKMIENREIP